MDRSVPSRERGQPVADMATSPRSRSGSKITKDGFEGGSSASTASPVLVPPLSSSVCSSSDAYSSQYNSRASHISQTEKALEERLGVAHGLRSLEHISEHSEKDAAQFAGRTDALKKNNEQMRGVITNLRQELRGKFVAKVPLLSTNVLTQEEQVTVVGKLKPKNFNADDVIVKEGHLGDELFIIERGLCEASTPSLPSCELGREEFFGELAVIYARPYPVTISAKTNVTLLSLSRADLLSSIGEETLTRLFNATRVRLFGNVPLLSNLSPRQKLCVAERLRSDVWPAGTVLARQRSHVIPDTRRLYIIEEGSCKKEESGKKQTVLPGQHFGMVSMFFGSPQSSTISAETEVKTLSISHSEMLQICDDGAEGEGIKSAVQKSMRCYLIRQLEALQDKEDDVIEMIEGHAKEVSFKKWDLVFRQGDKLDAIFILEEGSLIEYAGDMTSLEDAAPGSGDAPNTEDRNLPGTHFGAKCLQDSFAAMPTTLAASTDSTMLRIPGFVLRGMLKRRTIGRRSSLKDSIIL